MRLGLPEIILNTTCCSEPIIKSGEVVMYIISLNNFTVKISFFAFIGLDEGTWQRGIFLKENITVHYFFFHGKRFYQWYQLKCLWAYTSYLKYCGRAKFSQSIMPRVFEWEFYHWIEQSQKNCQIRANELVLENNFHIRKDNKAHSVLLCFIIITTLFDDDDFDYHRKE